MRIHRQGASRLVKKSTQRMLKDGAARVSLLALSPIKQGNGFGLGLRLCRLRFPVLKHTPSVNTISEISLEVIDRERYLRAYCFY